MIDSHAPIRYDEPNVIRVIDALPANAAILDGKGVIQVTNKAWRDFATQNGGNERTCGCHSSYLDVCEKSADATSPDATNAAAAIREIISSGRGRYETTYPCHSSTKERWYLMRAAPLGTEEGQGVLVTHEDVTDLVRARQDIELQRSNLQMLLDTAIDGIHVTDEEGNVRYFSYSFARMLGYSNEEMSHMNVKDWELPTDAAIFEDEFARLKSESNLADRIFRCKNDARIHVEVNEKSIVLAGEKYLYRSARDITQRLLDERQKSRDRQHLQELERINRDLDDFVYIASHDLRSPLRAVTSLSQWIIDDDRSVDPTTRIRLRQIQTRAQRMTRLLDSILVYAKAGKTGAVTGEKTTAESLIKGVVELLHLPDNFLVRLHPSLADAVVYAVPLDQVFQNLISNAVKHHDRDAGVVCIDVKSSGSHYRFSVVDDGPGVPEKYRESVFEMFTTLKPRDEVEGSGMGLALVQRIVRRLGGECAIESVDGRGARVWFDWPRPEE